MSIVVFNSSISLYKEDKELVQYCEGANQTRISIFTNENPKNIFNSDCVKPNTEYRVTIKLLNDPMTPSIIISKEQVQSDMLYGIYLPYTGYGENVVIGKENVIFSMRTSSAHTERTIMIVKDKVVIECLSYKNRRPSIYMAFNENRWKNLGTKSDIMANLNDELCNELATYMGWLSNVVTLA